jgi:type I restriction enzyme, S subunit
MGITECRPFIEVLGKSGKGFLDGDWILSEDMSDDGEIGIVQLKHIGNGKFLNKSFKFITKEKFKQLGCTQLKEGDLLVSRMAEPICRSCILPKLDFETVTAVDIAIIRPDPNIADAKYLNYLLNTQAIQNQAKKYSVGATRERISKKNLHKLLIPLPSIAVQKRTALILEKVEQLKEWRKQSDKLSGELLNSIFLRMFGGVNNEKKWSVTSLGEICTKITDGKHGDCQNETESGYFFLSSKDIRNGRLEYTNARQISKSDFEEVDRRTNLQVGDILLCNTGASIGRVGVVNESDKVRKITFQKSVAVITPMLEILNPYYLMYFLEMTNQNLVRNSSGSAQKNLLLSDIRKLKIFLPPIELQNAFASYFLKVSSIKEIQNQSSKNLEELFNTLNSRSLEMTKP